MVCNKLQFKIKVTPLRPFWLFLGLKLFHKYIMYVVFKKLLPEYLSLLIIFINTIVYKSVHRTQSIYV